jgi:hypothetical protein
MGFSPSSIQIRDEGFQKALVQWKIVLSKTRDVVVSNLGSISSNLDDALIDCAFVQRRFKTVEM